MATSKNQQFVRDRRRDLKKAKQALDKLRFGCACEDAYGEDTQAMHNAVNAVSYSLEIIDRITKKRV